MSKNKKVAPICSRLNVSSSFKRILSLTIRAFCGFVRSLEVFHCHNLPREIIRKDRTCQSLFSFFGRCELHRF